jgi:hypothetical protein
VNRFIAMRFGAMLLLAPNGRDARRNITQAISGAFRQSAFAGARCLKKESRGHEDPGG